MIRCPRCDHENPDDALECDFCGGQILRPEELASDLGDLGDAQPTASAAPDAAGIPAPDGAAESSAAPALKDWATRRLKLPQDASNMPKWGTAGFGPERRILLHVKGFDRPVMVRVTDPLTVGRFDTETGLAPDVDLEGYDAMELGVSRRHVTLLIADDALKVIDLDSANATFINGQRLIPHQARILRDGDELRLGRMVMRVQFA